MGVSKYGWLIMGKPMKMDDFGVPLFQETTILFIEVPEWMSCFAEASPALQCCYSSDDLPRTRVTV